MLNPLAPQILCVRGNCEAEVDQMVLDFPVLADYALLPEGERLIFATHGHRFHMDHPPKLQPGDILLHGHTHVPACVEGPVFTYLNPGSVSIPKESSPHSILLLEDGRFQWKDLEDGHVFQTWSMSAVR